MEAQTEQKPEQMNGEDQQGNPKVELDNSQPENFGEEVKERRLVIPGEVVVKGEEYLPGDWTEKKGDEIIAHRYGLVEESNRLIKIIPVSGPYHPRRGNVVIGRVENVTSNGWVIDIGLADNAFLSVAEVPRYVPKGQLEEVFTIGDMIAAKIAFIGGRGIDLTIKLRGFGKIHEGIIVKVNSNRVPRVIGKEGSMVKMIKDETECNITVGQNGLVWIKGNSIENETKAKKVITFIAENIFVHGLTDQVKKWFEENGGKRNSENVQEVKESESLNENSEDGE